MNSDYENHIRQLVDWHLSDLTGSKYWINRRDSGWTKEIVERWFLEGSPPRNHLDLEHDLRNLPIQSFIPQGVNKEDIIGVFESGGTTGSPKRVALGSSWMHDLLDWSAKRMLELGHAPGRNWLVSVPTGPHVVGELAVNAARNEGAHAFRIDIDPRWVKTADLYGGVADGYSAHLVSQMRSILMTQDIGCLVTTPPILLMLARDHSLVEIINKNRITIRWGGLSFDHQSKNFLNTTVFPNTPFFGVLGNTMTLGFGIETVKQSSEENPFEFHLPVNRLSIYDLEKDHFYTSGTGSIAYSHASLTHLYPPTPDRDSGRVVAGQEVYLEEDSLQEQDKSSGVY